MKICLKSRNNSFVWRRYNLEELGLARPATSIEVSMKQTTFLPIWTLISEHLE